MLSAALLLSLALGGSQGGGHVGLRNQGNTCYMNSLIQVLYHLPSFRRAVYALPTSADAPPGTSVPLELQRVFYELERASEADLPSVGTELLTRSLGMGPRDVNEQQDAQEFARTLCDALSGGEGDGEVGAVFEGRLLNYIRCTRVKHTSEREQRFSDLQMQVAGCGSLADSLREQFCAEETLDEYNTRTAEHGTQPARRGARIRQLPPVLQLHLQRFSYDPSAGTMDKLQQAQGPPREVPRGVTDTRRRRAGIHVPDDAAPAALSRARGGSGRSTARVRAAFRRIPRRRRRQRPLRRVSARDPNRRLPAAAAAAAAAATPLRRVAGTCAHSAGASGTSLMTRA